MSSAVRMPAGWEHLFLYGVYMYVGWGRGDPNSTTCPLPSPPCILQEARLGLEAEPPGAAVLQARAAQCPLWSRGDLVGGGRGGTSALREGAASPPRRVPAQGNLGLCSGA